MNILGLSGIDSASAASLMAAISSMTDADKAQVVSKLSNVNPGMENTTFATSRSKYISRINQLPADVANNIVTMQDQLNDSEIYSVVALGSAATSLSDLFAPDGAKVVGQRNIANQKTDAGKWFLVTAIEVLYGIDATNATGVAATFGFEPIPAALFNGELEITQNGRKIFSKQSLASFFTGVAAAAIAVGPLGKTYNGRAIVNLDNPKFIYPQQELKGRLEFAAAPGAANSFIKIRLIGTVNERA